ncbi:MAG: hypothetical protein Fur0019_12500 [Tibeticola sp.]
MKAVLPTNFETRRAVGQKRISQSGRQRGVVLIISLFILLAITLLAVGFIESLGLDERMAGNFKDRQVAFQAAEAGLRDAEQLILSNTTGPFSPLRPGDFSTDCVNALCASSVESPRFVSFTEADWTGTKTRAYGSLSGAPALDFVASQPRYVVEYQGTVQPIEPGKPCVAIFSVAARASGGSENTRVTLQSTVRLRAGECYAAI